MSVKTAKNLCSILWLIAVVAVALPVYSMQASDFIPSAEQFSGYGRLGEYHTSTIVSIVAMLFAFLISSGSNKHVLEIIREHNKALIQAARTGCACHDKRGEENEAKHSVD